MIDNQLDIDKIYLYAKDLHEEKYQVLINRRESTGLKPFNDPKAFIEYWNDTKDIEEYNIGKNRKILRIFDYMIADMINKKELNPVVT